MNNHSALLSLMGEKFNNIDFEKIEQKSDNSWELVDSTGSMYVRVLNKKLQVSMDSDFLVIFEEISI